MNRCWHNCEVFWIV